ncbi:hypothetical protein LPJ66_005152 [Kickxella alabastrina]|uniref:Uncharacterized protein n=1 Tax=Kickxella alabastrina TaxID=61397 RepID=A0ACC1IFK1_9FUNG|nr:hypothetical protein LPJ66_005152 [Kickxella alabastrina]
MTAGNTAASNSTVSQAVMSAVDCNRERGATHSSAAPFMTNANYRIITSSPGASSDDRKRTHFVLPTLESGLPSWISSASQSKTHLPALSPIVDGECSFAEGNKVYGDATAGSSGCQSHISAANAGNSMDIDEAQELRIEYDLLPYEIQSWSSHSANFLPKNILVDRPHDQASRWSTSLNNHRQYITLRLERPALVPHVCNLKEFKVFGGMSQDNMIELLYSGLRNDSEPEMISLKQKLNGYYIPCQYIRIQPLLAHDQKFNFSIWHVELRGTMDPQIIHGLISDFNLSREQEVIRSCLKFFRDHNYTSAFSALEQQAVASLEAPVLTKIYHALVDNRDYSKAEELLCQAEREGMFASCTSRIPYAAAWQPADLGSYVVPPPRGGHQMCVDEESRYAYLYGGWDGANNLGDLWMLKMDTGRWTCISENTRDEGGPGPRSCHAMCFDSVQKCIYIMGKYVDHEYRGNTGLENDLFCYDTVSDEWIVLSENTEVHDGPRLLFNTQMAFDPHFCCIYVYGGKVVLPDANDSTIVYSGLYRYDLRKHNWTRLKPDFHMLEQEQHVRGRYFHSMIIDPSLQRLYILSSKRNVSIPSDLIIYDIATNTFYEKMADLAASNPTSQLMTQQQYLSDQQRLSPAYSVAQAQAPMPPPDNNSHHPHHVHLLQDGRTIRTSLDTERQELYVLASAQSDSSSTASAPSMQNLMLMHNARSSQSRYYDPSGTRPSYTSAAQMQAAGAGFHPCSSLVDAGARREPAQSGTHNSLASGSNSCGATGGSYRAAARYSEDSDGQHQGFQMPADHILMVVFCYHIPTETWTEVYNSAQTAAAFVTSMNDHSGSGESPFANHAGRGSVMPPFPLARFAQDWVYDRANRTHFMFGGNPNRPSDKSARFNDTWELKFTRPSSQDILRRALYLVRQRQFLDLCAGLDCDVLNQESCAAEPLVEYKASAIPSPNTVLLGGSNPTSSHSKRAPSLDADTDESMEHQSQRQRMAVTDAMMTASTSGPSSSKIPRLAPEPSSVASCTAFTNNTALALEYLQRFVAPLVNHNDPAECQSFHALSIALFQITANEYSRSSPEALRKARGDVFEALLAYFSERQQQPQSHLDEAVAVMLN